MNEYFIVAHNKIGATYSKKVFYQGSPITIEIRHGFGTVRTTLELHTVQRVLHNLGITVYTNREEFEQRIREAQKNG